MNKGVVTCSTYQAFQVALRMDTKARVCACDMNLGTLKLNPDTCEHKHVSLSLPTAAPHPLEPLGCRCCTSRSPSKMLFLTCTKLPGLTEIDVMPALTRNFANSGWSPGPWP